MTTLPLLPSEYTVEITIGGYSFTVTSADAAIEDSVNVLDNLRIGWSKPTASPFPYQPVPVTMDLGLMTRDVANLSDLDIGTPIQVKAYGPVPPFDPNQPPGGRYPFVAFTGRISDLDCKLSRFGTATVLLYSITAVDYTVDANEVTIDLERPAEDAADRLPAITEAIEAANPGLLFHFPSLFPGWQFEALSVVRQPGLDVLLDHLRQLPRIGNGTPPGRLLVVPRTEDGVFQEYVLHWPMAPTVETYPPMTFDVVDGLFQPVLDVKAINVNDFPAGLMVDAGEVLTPTVSYNRSKLTQVNTVDVTGPDFNVTVARTGVRTRPVGSA